LLVDTACDDTKLIVPSSSEEEEKELCSVALGTFSLIVSVASSLLTFLFIPDFPIDII
jgi:hypothetical protein